MRRWRLALLGALLALLAACGSRQPGGAGLELERTGEMELQYAEQFQVEYYQGGYALITIANGDRFLLVPQGGDVPDGAGEEITVLRQPLEHIYLASSSVMDLFLRLDALDAVTMTATPAESWSIPRIREAVRTDRITYVGKYSAPDYEYILDEGCGMAVENTMIYHEPETKEQLERLGIPVLVERSSYEPEPLGRVEWIKLYGLLTGRTAQAEAFFDESVARVEAVAAQEPAGKTVAFFYFTASGAVNVRRTGDYIPRMIELAGGTYVLSDPVEAGGAAQSSMNMEAEAFYAAAGDADILIYNGTVDGGPASLEALVREHPMLGDFRAVRDGNVWCTGQNMFQQVSGTAEMISELHRVITGTDGDELTFLYRLN